MAKDIYLLMRPELIRATLAGKKWQTRRVVKPQPVQPAANCHPNHTAKHTAPYLDADCGERKASENPRGMSENWCWWQVDNRQCLPTFKCPYGKPGDVAVVREGGWQSEERFYAYSATLGTGRCSDDPLGTFIEVPPDEAASWSSNDWKHYGWKRTSPIHMPRWAARIVRPITEIRIERVAEISEEDAIAEGVGYWFEGLDPDKAHAVRLITSDGGLFGSTAQCLYQYLWNSINLDPKPRYGRVDGEKTITHYEAFPWGVEDFDAICPGAREAGTWKGKPLHVHANPWVWVISYERREEAAHGA